MYITASARGGWHALGTRLALYFLWCNRPYSSGALTLATSDQSAYPVVDFNLLSDCRDLERMMSAVRLLARLVIRSVLNSESSDFFPLSYSPRIKRLTDLARETVSSHPFSARCSTCPPASGSC
jgi:5-(hydroxymethyl)furfural/furfural oxidase